MLSFVKMPHNFFIAILFYSVKIKFLIIFHKFILNKKIPAGPRREFFCSCLFSKADKSSDECYSKSLFHATEVARKQR